MLVQEDIFFHMLVLILPITFMLCLSTLRCPFSPEAVFLFISIGSKIKSDITNLFKFKMKWYCNGASGLMIMILHANLEVSGSNFTSNIWVLCLLWIYCYCYCINRYLKTLRNGLSLKISKLIDLSSLSP